MTTVSFDVNIKQCITTVLIIAIFGTVWYNFNITKEHIHSNSIPRLVLYYAKWCGHSQSFLPEWHKFKDSIKNKNIVTEEIVCEGKDQETKCSHLIGYPSVILYINNMGIPFNGDRTTSGLQSFIDSYIDSY